MSEKFEFDSNFQITILAMMLSEADFCAKASLILKPEYFASEHFARIFTEIKTLHDNSSEMPTFIMLFNQIKQTVKIENQEPYLVIIRKIHDKITGKIFKSESDYVRDQITAFVKRAMLWQLNQKLVAQKYNDPDMLYEKTMLDFENMRQVNFDEDRILTLDQIDNIIDNIKNCKDNVIPLGLPDIDKALGGGILKKTLTVVLGGTNVGKSIFLTNATCTMVRKKFKVMYVTLEGDETQGILRLTSRCTQIPYGRLKFYEIDDREKKIKDKFIEETKDYIQFKHHVAFNYTIEDLFAYCKAKKNDFDFDVLMVDYGQLLNTKLKQEAVRHIHAAVHRGLATMASVLNIAVVTVAQATRDMQEKNRKGTDLLRMNDVSEAFEIVRVSATVLTLNRSENDEKGELCRILLEKQREGKRGIIQICKTNLDTVSLYGDVDEGLGFMTADQYTANAMANCIGTEQTLDGKKELVIQ